MSGSFSHAGDLTRVGWTDRAVTHAGMGDAADHPKDERFTRQRQEGLARKAAGAQPRRDHAEDGHGGTYKMRAATSRAWCVPRLRNSPAIAYRARSRWTRDGIRSEERRVGKECRSR